MRDVGVPTGPFQETVPTYHELCAERNPLRRRGRERQDATGGEEAIAE